MKVPIFLLVLSLAFFYSCQKDESIADSQNQGFIIHESKNKTLTFSQKKILESFFESCSGEKEFLDCLKNNLEPENLGLAWLIATIDACDAYVTETSEYSSGPEYESMMMDCIFGN